MSHLSDIQKTIYENKKNQGFNTTDIPLEFAYLYGEVAEAFDAWRKKNNTVPEELADIAIYLLGMAEIIGCDLGEEIEKKVSKNKNRVYAWKDGVHTRISD